MKIGKLILGIALFTAANSYAQDDQQRECDRMLYLAQLARIERSDYKESTTYLLKAEKTCGELDKKTMDLLLASAINSQIGLTDPAEVKAYADTLELVFQMMDAKSMYEQKYDLQRATNLLGSSTPDMKKADEYYVRGIKLEGDNIAEGYVTYYYYNLYNIYAATSVDDRPNMKRRLINDYFDFSALAARKNFSAGTVDYLSQFLDNVVRSCDDILPDLPGFMKNLAQDKEIKKNQVNQFLSLLEKKGCTDEAEYFALIDTLVKVDPTAIGVKLKQADGLLANKKYSQAREIYQDISDKFEDSKTKNEIQYKIAFCTKGLGSYKAAYTQAMAVGGDSRSDALVIAASCVAALANDCGASTFDRKCNYLYAAQLMEQAGRSGAAYKANGPSSEDCFNEGNPKSVSLTCWGVTVNPCP